MVLYCHFRRRASFAVPRRSPVWLFCVALLEVLIACATAETQEIAWQGRAAIWVVLVPEH